MFAFISKSDELYSKMIIMESVSRIQEIGLIPSSRHVSDVLSFRIASSYSIFPIANADNLSDC